MSPTVPPPGEFAPTDPRKLGLDPAALDRAARFALQNECTWPRSMYLDDGRYIGTAYVEDRPPYDQVLGPVWPRGGASLMVLRHGCLAHAAGDVARADMTFSAAKSYLAVLAGLAWDDKLISDLDEPVRARVPDGFNGPHNGRITWRHLLTQTSEWQGTLWDRPDSVDHNRQAGVEHDNRGKGTPRALETPGARWEYNDVRVNVLAWALLQLFRQPLPQVLRRRIMDPIGASADWEWRGYANSTVAIDGTPMESVSGGGHWGGGIRISAADHARFGLLIHRRGDWEGRQLLSPGWIERMLTPCAANPSYGFLWWLNTGKRLFPSAPEGSAFALGGGQHVVWLDPAHDMVVVARWIERARCDALMAQVLAALA